MEILICAHLTHQVNISKFYLKVNFNSYKFKIIKGINDPYTAHQTIDTIVELLRSEPFNQLIILIEYQRTSTDFFQSLEIIERCLNGLVDQSVMLIMNKVPNKSQIEKARRENKHLDLDLEQIWKNLQMNIVKIFDFVPTVQLNIVDEQTENDRKENEATLDTIRNYIETTEELQFSNVTTWSELVME